MFLTPLIQMKDGTYYFVAFLFVDRRSYQHYFHFSLSEYLDRDHYNLFFIDWSILAPAPCYPSACQNTRHAGKCIAQLIDRIKDSGTENIHVIGFSLGAHVANFAANNLKEFKIPRITGEWLFIVPKE